MRRSFWAAWVFRSSRSVWSMPRAPTSECTATARRPSSRWRKNWPAVAGSSARRASCGATTGAFAATRRLGLGWSPCRRLALGSTTPPTFDWAGREPSRRSAAATAAVSTVPTRLPKGRACAAATRPRWPTRWRRSPHRAWTCCTWPTANSTCPATMPWRSARNSRAGASATASAGTRTWPSRRSTRAWPGRCGGPGASASTSRAMLRPRSCSRRIVNPIGRKNWPAPSASAARAVSP